jgi:cell wall-associated NlpC family hydrolase
LRISYNAVRNSENIKYLNIVVLYRQGVSETVAEIVMANFIVASSIADIHRDPDPSSELVTQALMNTPVIVGEISGDWTYVTLPDYSGWMATKEIETPIVRGYCEGEGTCGVTLPYSVVVTKPYAKLYQHLYAENDEILAEVYLSTALPYIDLAHPQRLRVALPRDAEGWLAREDVEVRSNTELFPQQEISVVISYAKAFLGVPYLWGGTSWRGIDCSGLVQLCYRMGGYILPRDAEPQYGALPHEIQREHMQAGDLIFFGHKQITHVALALNKDTYIHAEGQQYNQVTINSLDKAHPAYSALAERIWGIKRVHERSKEDEHR